MIAAEIDRFVRTGESDPLHGAWPGSLLERARLAHDDLRGALVRAVRERSAGRSHHPVPPMDAIAFTRARVEPMVRGLFPRAEWQTVLGNLSCSVVFLDDARIEQVLAGPGFHHLAWQLANLYLAGLDAELLSPDAPRLAGLSVEATCYVSPNYFAEGDPFADFVVHEIAHIFHNCKRDTWGLPSSRSKEWLLNISYAKRETFAYSCEAFSRVISRARTPAERRALAEQYGREPRIFDDRVDPTEVASIVAEAASARNGWKLILSRCAPALI